MQWLKVKASGNCSFSSSSDDDKFRSYVTNLVPKHVAEEEIWGIEKEVKIARHEDAQGLKKMVEQENR